MILLSPFRKRANKSFSFLFLRRIGIRVYYGLIFKEVIFLKVFFDKGPLTIVVDTTKRTFKKISMYEVKDAKDYVTIVHETGTYGPKLLLSDLEEFFDGQGYKKRPKETLKERLSKRFRRKET